MARQPRLVFGKSNVKFRKGDRSSFLQSDDEMNRSSMDSTAGRGSYIHNPSDFTFKVVLLGDANVGKTCLARFIVHRTVTTDQTENTIGFDHHIKEMLVDGLPVMINLWDTAGMEQFRNALVQQYYRNVNGIVFVFDITRQDSFENVDTWYTEAMNYSENRDRLKMVLMGNKRDMVEERVVLEQTARNYADARGMDYVEVSAKDVKCLDTLDTVMMTLANQMIADREENSFTRSMTNVIRLREEDWEIVEKPEGQVPENVYRDQDESERMSYRSQLTSSVRTALVRTNNRVRSSNRCNC